MRHLQTTQCGRASLAFAFGLLLGACASSAPLHEPSALPKRTAPVVQKPLAPKERLLRALRQIDRPAPILELLPKAALAVLDTRLAALAPEQKEQLLQTELAETMPLLHLRAGGSSAVALLTLATTPAATQELPNAFELQGVVADADRLRVVRFAHDLAQRAALHFLRDRVLDVSAAPSTELKPVLAAIERAAAAADRPDVTRLALETWAASGAESDVLIRLAVACAYEQDEKCVADVAKGIDHAAPERERLSILDKALATRADGDPIVKAWSLLQLGRYSDASAVLAPLAPRAPADLRIAAARAVAIADGTACPGLQPSVAPPALCADAFVARPGLRQALADMESAWQSRTGRDAASTEAYLGLAHVVPWVTALATASDQQSLERSFTARYEALARVLAELPDQRALAVYAAALAAGVGAGLHVPHGERPRIEPEVKQELWRKAQEVEAAAPRLAVASIVAADQPVVEILPKAAPPALLPAYAGLRAWEAASGTDAQTLEAARSALAEQLKQDPHHSVDSSTAVLLLAELDAAATPSERTYAALAQVAGQLIGQPLPPELALRAVLDAAGALERMGRSSDALGVLTKAAEIGSLPGPAADLLRLIRAEKLVLEWDAKRDPGRKALAKALSDLSSGSTSRAIALAMGAWANDPRLRKGPGSKQTLGERIGSRAAESLRKGVLRGTRVSLRLSYTFQSGVTPDVRFEPMLLPLVRPDLIQKAL